MFSLATAERSVNRPLALLDVRDRYRERQRADGLASMVAGLVQFRVRAITFPQETIEPEDLVLKTTRTMSGVMVFGGEIVDGGRRGIVKTLAPDATQVAVRVSSPRFRPADIAFQPGPNQRVTIDLAPGVNYRFGDVPVRAGGFAPTLMRGSIVDQSDRGVPDASVAVAEGVYTDRTEQDGAWIIVLADDLVWPVTNPPTPPTRTVDIVVTLSPTDRWQTAQVVNDPNNPQQWQQNGLVLTCSTSVTAGRTNSVTNLRLELT